MERTIENKNKNKSKILSKNKNDILMNIKSILNFINSKDEITYNFFQFNESLFINHKKWLEDIRKEIKDAIKSSEPNINISDINYDNSLLSLLQKIAKPYNCHNNIKNNDIINENINNNEIFKKIDEITNLENLNDMFGIINNYSKYKRDSLLSKNRFNENKKDNDDDGNNDLYNEHFQIEYNDKDINMEQFNYDKKNNFEEINNQIENDENSLCTIVEIPSLEEREKNSKTSKINNHGSNQISLSNKNNNANNESNNNNNNVVIENYNNINVCDINTKKLYNNIYDINCFKPLNITESNSEKDHKYNDYSINEKINIGDNYNINNNNCNDKINIPFFTEIKNKDYFSEKNNISLNENTNLTFNKTNNLLTTQKSSNKKEKIFAKLDNNNNSTQKIEISSTKNKNKNNVIIIQTSKKMEQMQKNENENSSSNKKNYINYNDLFHKNYVQKIILSSSKKAMNDKKEKEKYEDNFEEYEISDSSLVSDDEEDEENKGKFVPKWAKDEEYINEKIKKQNNDKELVKKSFGNFVIENLNLNMIFETHIKDFDIRHSTADWRGEDDSLEKNKVTNIKNKEIDDIFPNRKLQF